MIIGNTTSDFVFSDLFKLNFSKTTGHTNSKHGTIDQHTQDERHNEIDVVTMTSQLNITFYKLHFLMQKCHFELKAITRLVSFTKTLFFFVYFILYLFLYLL